MQLGRAGDRNDPWLLRQQPCESNLSGCRLLSFDHLALCNLLKQIDQNLIRFSVLRHKPRDGTTKIAAIEPRSLVDLACQEALPKRAKWNEADSKLLKGRQQVLFTIAEPKRVLALDSGDGLNCVGPADRVCGCLRHPEVLDLALLNEVLHCSSYVFDRSFRIHAVLIVEIDGIHFEPLE